MQAAARSSLRSHSAQSHRSPFKTFNRCGECVSVLYPKKSEEKRLLDARLLAMLR
jgi:hypothetical protein